MLPAEQTLRSLFAALLSSIGSCDPSTKGRTAKFERKIYHPPMHRSFGYKCCGRRSGAFAFEGTL